MADQRRFANAPQSVGQARRFAVAAAGTVPEEVADELALMVSELATNSVRHAATHFTVRVEREGHRIRVAVGDTGPGEPSLRSPGPLEPTGRGLQIVRALADDWGVTPVPDGGGPGKTVWFTLDISPRSAQAVDT